VNPLTRVQELLHEAFAAGIPEADTMALATATPDGRPSVRYVLLKGIDDRGVRFFTNYDSRKGRELAANPRAAATLYWQPLHRAVRIEGTVERLPAADSDAYFASRPRGGQRGARGAQQGAMFHDRTQLEARMRELELRYPAEVPRPDHWGGYRLVPDVVEFWTGRPNRLHDREHFLAQPDGSWRVERLSP
jgi:pyridoxamine 5'-phosphate oxidase